MPKRKKKTTALPRVTVLAFNRRDLLAFCEAVNSLRFLVNDLLIVTERMQARKKPKAAAAAAAELVTPALPGTT